jgi:phage tail sheath protein FI
MRRWQRSSAEVARPAQCCVKLRRITRKFSPTSTKDVRNAHIATQTSTTLSADQPIAREHAAITAFIGRTLRGPVNTPIAITNFTEFQATFGGLWQPSPLSYAVEHFFEQGGVQAIVVRVINGGAAPTITLACGTEQLVLQALTPGTREFLRAAVDYDNLGEDEESFNLVIQRVRAPGSERIEVQETYRRVSINPGTQRYVANVLVESQLVRVRGAVPTQRPDLTLPSNAATANGYASSNNDGDDGAPITDYDIIGSATQHTGIFALDSVERMQFLYVPPLARGQTDERQVGLSTLVIAEAYCRRRHAMLIVDPPRTWASAEDAVRGLESFDFRSSHALMYFPRIIAMDRLRARPTVFGNGGAVAGMLARAESQRPVWAMDAPEAELVPRAGLRLAATLGEAERWRLTNHGINALRTARNSSIIRPLSRTLSGGIHSAADWGYLGPQRFADFIVTSVEHGTRWTRLVSSEPAVWQRVARQVTRFMNELALLGAFPTTVAAQQAFMVVCDERVHRATDLSAKRVNVLVAFAASRIGQYHGFIVAQSPQGASIRSVAVNALQLPVVIEPWLDTQVAEPTPGDAAAAAG